MRNCFEGREHGELLSLALICMRLIDAAFKADRQGRLDWWPEGEDFNYNSRAPSYAKTWVVCRILGDGEHQKHQQLLAALTPRKAIEVLHRIQQSALWHSDRGVPAPDLSSLRASTTGEEK